MLSKVRYRRLMSFFLRGKKMKKLPNWLNEKYSQRVLFIKIVLCNLFCSSMFGALICTKMNKTDLVLLGEAIVATIGVRDLLSQMIASLLLKKLKGHKRLLMKIDIFTNILWAGIVIGYIFAPSRALCLISGALIICDIAILAPLGKYIWRYCNQELADERLSGEGTEEEKKERSEALVDFFQSSQLFLCSLGGLLGYSMAAVCSAMGANAHMYLGCILFLCGAIIKFFRLKYIPEDF